MVKRQCICGAHLYGLGHTGPNMFGFIPSSSLAHYNYDCEFNTGVTLPGGRILEQCENCGAIVLCEYPTLDGSRRGRIHSSPTALALCTNNVTSNRCR